MSQIPNEPNPSNSSFGSGNTSPAQSENLPKVPPLDRNVKLLGLASFLNDVASEMIFPLLPAFLLSLPGGSLAMLGWLDGLAESIASLLKLAGGAWAGKMRKFKWWIIPGYTLAALIRPLLAFAAIPSQVVAIRLGDRIGKGIRTAPRDTLIALSTDPAWRGQAFGFHRAMDHLGAALGPMVTLLFLLWFPGQERTLFFWTLVPGILVTGLLVWGLKDPHQRQSPESIKNPEPTPPLQSMPPEPSFTEGSLSGLDNRFKMFLLAMAIFTMGNTSDLFLLARSKELGVTNTPLLWFVFHLAKSLGNLRLGRWADRVSPRGMILYGWLVYAGVYGLFAIADSAWHAWALFGVYALFYSLTEPAEKTLVSNIVPGRLQGLAFGWFHMVIGLTTLPANVLFGWIYDRWGALAAFGWGGSMALFAAILLLGCRSNRMKE